MANRVTVAYYSTSKGVTQQQTGSVITYYGSVFRISRELFSEEGEVDFENEINELIERISDLGLEPLLDGTTVERYETWDVETGDVLVMYRIPCASKKD